MSSSNISWNIGDILVCYPIHSGCSSYPVFGRIIKLTPSGKFRVVFLSIESTQIDKGLWGSCRVVKPILEKNGEMNKTILLSYCPKNEIKDGMNEESINRVKSMLFGSSKSEYTCWERYKPENRYTHDHDNGD